MNKIKGKNELKYTDVPDIWYVSRIEFGVIFFSSLQTDALQGAKFI
ncbi:MAG: hypothetical protein ACRCSR_10245 [Bacteroidales bacterium]